MSTVESEWKMVSTTSEYFLGLGNKNTHVPAIIGANIPEFNPKNETLVKKIFYPLN